MNTDNVQIPAWLDRDEIVRRVIQAGIEIEAGRIAREMRIRAKRLNVDPITVWLQERTVPAPRTWTPQSDLFADYVTWCQENGVVMAGTARSFSKCLEIRGYEKRQSKAGVARKGISLAKKPL
jgi:phage/plasmid-associated DNA primase